jgi:hypothetical protein
MATNLVFSSSVQLDNLHEIVLVSGKGTAVLELGVNKLVNQPRLQQCHSSRMRVIDVDKRMLYKLRVSSESVLKKGEATYSLLSSLLQPG